MGVVMFENVTSKQRMGLPAAAAVAAGAAVAFGGMLLAAKVIVGDPLAAAVAGMQRAPLPVEREAEEAALAQAFRVDEEIVVVAPGRPRRLVQGRPVARADQRWTVPVAVAEAPMCPVAR